MTDHLDKAKRSRNMTQLILYTSEDGQAQVQLRAEQGTVWLSQLEMVELFKASKQNISLHLKNIFEDGELDPSTTVKESLTVQTEGGREVRRSVALYNLAAILAVGYRVRSPRGVQFRRWASSSNIVKGCNNEPTRTELTWESPPGYCRPVARRNEYRRVPRTACS